MKERGSKEHSSSAAELRTPSLRRPKYHVAAMQVPSFVDLVVELSEGIAPPSLPADLFSPHLRGFVSCPVEGSADKQLQTSEASEPAVDPPPNLIKIDVPTR